MDSMPKVVLKASLCIGVVFLALAPGLGCATGDLPKKGDLAPGDVPGPQVNVPLTMVATLQPTFQWTLPKEPGLSCDFIICEGVLERHGYWVPGKTAYYRAGLTTGTHTIDRPLAPNTVYVWSVRSRVGKKISTWAAYSDENPSLFKKDKQQYNILCPFKTPAS
jgi:hypothetical protein